MAENSQNKTERVRPGRVQIRYDVETNGAREIRELPFVLGVMADLSGDRSDIDIGNLKDRKFKDIDRENLDQVMSEDAKPTLNFTVANKLTDDDTKLRINLEFKTMQDFEPAKVADQIAPLKELLDMRKRLDAILDTISKNNQLESVLQELLDNNAKVEALAQQLKADEGNKRWQKHQQKPRTPPLQRPPATTTTIEKPSENAILDQLIDKGFKPKDDAGKERAKQFIGALVQQALTNKEAVISGDLERTIRAWQAEIDRKLSAQLNEILHHEKFQKLEGTWRGMKYLVSQTEESPTLKIKVLNVRKETLMKDFDRAVDYDRTALFQMVHQQEYGQLGGNPYGMLMGDYDFDGKNIQDVKLLEKIASVSAQAHAPFVAAASPQMFGIDSFTELMNPLDLAKGFDVTKYPEFTRWKMFRESDDSRYTALTLPRVLARSPYGEGGSEKPVEEFKYNEDVDGTNHNKYLWMNAAWAYAARVTNAFAIDGWFMRTRGVEGGGTVEGLPLHIFNDAGGKTAKCPTETLIPDSRELELSKLGFLPLLHYKNTDKAVFMGSQTTNQPKKFNDPAATSNAELSAKLNYMMCVSRFAHYLKQIARDKVGSFTSRENMELWMNNWINEYVHPSPLNASPEALAQSPLAEARVTVTDVKGRPGWYQAVAHLRPHFQLEGVTTSMRLVAEVPAKKA